MQFPECIRKQISQWDLDGSGTVGATELSAAVEAWKQMKRQSKLMKRALVALVFVVILLAGAMFATSLASAEISKDQRPDAMGIARIKGSNTPVAMASAEQRFQLSEIFDEAKYSVSSLMGIKSVAFKTASGSHAYEVAGVNRRTANGVTTTAVMTSTGHTVQVTKWGATLVYPKVEANAATEGIVSASESRRLTQRVEEIHLLKDGQGRRLAATDTAFVTAVTTTQDQKDDGPTTSCDSQKESCVTPHEVEPTQDEKDNARFLMQATFGPTAKTLTELQGTTYKAWIDAQMALPIGSHRAYFRKHANPRLNITVEAGQPLPRCEAGSRWFGRVFTVEDKDKEVTLDTVDGKTQVFVGGMYRGDVNPLVTDGIKFPVDRKGNAVPASSFPATLTSPGEVGEDVRINFKPNDGGEKFEIANPLVWVADVQLANSADDWTVQTIESQLAADVVITTVVGACDSQKQFIVKDGKFYTFDSRLQLFDNTMENPAETPFKVACPNVKRNFVNSAHCKIAKTCESFNVYHRSRLDLRLSNFKKILKVSGRYVYAATGFPVTSSPCGVAQTTSRWKQCEKTGTKSNCGVATTGNAVAGIVKELEDGKAEWGPMLAEAEKVLDIDVTCSAQNVPAGAVVTVGTGKNSVQYHHVHSKESNVYDLTTWIEEGGHVHDGTFILDMSVLSEAIFEDALDTPGVTKLENEIAVKDFPNFRKLKKYTTTFYKDCHFGGRIAFQSLPAALQTRTLVESFGAQAHRSSGTPTKSAPYFLACGSPGEAGSVGTLGHNLPFDIDGRNNMIVPDRFYDNNPASKDSDSKVTVWIRQALHTEDQLRQRVAWALSQVFVVVDERPKYNEVWLVFYDILVRNAFGNFRDILREVTYSTPMGNFLSYRKNTAYDVNRVFPDENYAREIMQLFTIGLFKLNDDGSEQMKDGRRIDTYNSENIEEFARVFTGFDEENYRGNIELGSKGTSNGIDPMQMREKWHDVYPKQGLDANYLGDGYPMCSNVPPGAFLSKGSLYNFVGFGSGLNYYVLKEGSMLFKALCGATTMDSCTFGSARITLPKSLVAVGEEGLLDSVSVVKVGKGFYEYMPPACVYFTFFSGGRIAANSKYRDPTTSNANKGLAGFLTSSSNKCLDPLTPFAGTSCCSIPDANTCTNDPIPGKSNTCTKKIREKTCKKKGWKNKNYCQFECATKFFVYRDGNTCAGGLKNTASATAKTPKHACSLPQEQVRYEIAEKKCNDAGMTICNEYVAGNEACNYEEPRTLARPLVVWTPTPCSVRASYDMLTGRIRLQDSDDSKQNAFDVQWIAKQGEAWIHRPAPNALKENWASECSGQGCTLVGEECFCDVFVSTHPVVSQAPTTGQVKSDLKIGTQRPTNRDRIAQSGIWVYPSDPNKPEAIDAETVFEYPEGVFWLNQISVVTVGTGTNMFRNPPRFSSPEKNTQKEALDEVESLLDHLFHHPNVAPFVAFRMIQRFTSSSPSTKYVKDVATAFKTGTYNGEVYSGKEGCLAATIAAVLLHEEARDLSNAESTTGQLREPILKVMHFMRAMQYEELGNKAIIFSKLEQYIGQKPYNAPDVFNFYTPKYQPASFPANAYGPEFQIFTAPYATGFLNGMMELLDNGVSGCVGGFGRGIKTGELNTACGKTGELKWTPVSNTAKGVVTELDLMLTGGSMSTFQKDIAQQAYTDAADKGKPGLKAAQQVILMTPEFHTAGKQEDLGEADPEPEIVEGAYDGDYKAFVFLYFKGGADTFNMLAPHSDCQQADEYATVRGIGTAYSVGIPKAEMRAINTVGQACAKFGLHKNFGDLANLYDKGQVAFLTNIGMLLEPITRHQYYKGGAQQCVGLYSHNDQSNAAHTLTCDISGTGSKGLGGRLGDHLSEAGFKTASFSTSGNAIFSQGYKTNTDVVSAGSGSATFHRFEEFQSVISNITSRKQFNIYAQEYQRAFAYGIEASENLAKLLEAVVSKTKAYKAETPSEEASLSKLDQQFRQVAAIIQTRQARKAQRDLFHVSMSGFDMHNEVNLAIAARWLEVNAGLNKFVKELEEQKIFDNVVLVTGSDFARTLTSNGKGTDHGWAGNYIVLGGKVKGGRVLNKYFDSLGKGNDQDAGRGKLIPQYPMENIMVPVAKWMGATEASQLDSIFPNLKNFANSAAQVFAGTAHPTILEVSDVFNP